MRDEIKGDGGRQVLKKEVAMLDTYIKRVGFAIMYLGLMIIVVAFKVPLSMLAVPLIGLFLAGIATIFLPDKVTNHWIYKPILIGWTVAMLISPILMLEVLETLLVLE